MNSLRTSIELIFHSHCANVVLDNLYSNDGSNVVISFPKSVFLSLAKHLFLEKSLNEIANVFQKLDEDWFFDVYNPLPGRKSIFNLLMHFNKQVLTEVEGQPFIEYQHLLRWRETSHLLGEDIFSCSYLAYMDLRSSRDRRFFAWRHVLFSNNQRLKKLLSSGMSENQFHLKGSGPVFELSWTYIMNNPSKISKPFRSIKKSDRLSTENFVGFSIKDSDLQAEVYRASHIRLQLWQELMERNLRFDDELVKLSTDSRNLKEWQMELAKIQSEINLEKQLFGLKFQEQNRKSIIDYCISSEVSDSNWNGAITLIGERLFLYHAFRLCYSNKASARFQHLFYAYLLTKSKLRAELIQVNSKLGFGNFSTYQDRKSLFIPENSIYELAYLNNAISGTKKFQKLNSFELRITPKNSLLDTKKEFELISKSNKKNCFRTDLSYVEESNINSVDWHYKNDLFYTLHFIKISDSHLNEITENAIERHNELRKVVKKQAQVVTKGRELGLPEFNLIRGVDAASSEFNARPEVFAQVFRYLKDHKVKGKNDALREILSCKDQGNSKVPKLSGTFHAGEDFFDIVDGLRTIDEAIKFLNLTQGDRVGHALALGISVSDFYQLKGNELMISKEMLMDNLRRLNP